jgi:putative redox protein
VKAQETDMAVTIEIGYLGELHCDAAHGPSRSRLMTDAPTDNGGKGETFSPTDLVGVALGSCILTTMGIAARRRGWDMSGARADVEKEMSSVPRRHIAKLTVRASLPARLDPRAREVLEAAAETYPVTASLGPLTEIDLRFEYV